MNRFLCAENFLKGGIYVLSEEESHHLTKVMRLAPGDKVEVINGRGAVAEATVVECGKKKATVRIEQVKEVMSHHQVHVVFGVMKAPAMDFIFRRLVEVGVASFQPVITRHSLHPEGFNEERWEKVIIEVSKQCQETVFPKIFTPVALNSWLQNRTTRPLVVCDELERQKDLGVLNGEVDLLIGPEGGWHAEELARLRELGAIKMGLGQNRLRGETAALVATVLLKTKLGYYL